LSASPNHGLLTFMGRKASGILVVVLMCTSADSQNDAKQTVGAVQMLKHYIQLRLEDADWKEYSKFVTWPDEPSWDCKWVVSKYEVGSPAKEKGKVNIPVAYQRLGLYCNNFYFEPGAKITTINHVLVKSERGWRVDAPIPDYPELGVNVLMRSLRAAAGDAKETPEHRTQAQKLADTINASLDVWNRRP
jgi:hypothetical protein